MSAKKMGQAMPGEQAPVFTKCQLMEPGAVDAPRDALCALLGEEDTYTKAQAKTLADEFMRRKV